MDLQHDKIIQSARGLLTSNDTSVLKETVDKLIERCVSSLEFEERGDIIRDFYLRLAKESIQLNNIRLAALSVEGLNAKQLSRIVKTAVGKSDHEKLTALSIVNSHIQHIHTDIILNKELQAPNQNDFNISSVLCSNFLDPERLENKYPSKQNELMKRMIYSILASHHEASENFNDALTNYENSGTQYEHLPRTTMKHLICSTHKVLQEYCATSAELQNFWVKYLIILKDYPEAVRFCDHSESLPPRTKYMLIHQASSGNLMHGIEAEIPVLLKSFIDNKEVTKWFNQRQTGLVVDSITNLSSSTRVQLAEILCRKIQFNEKFDACCLAFCLGFTRKFLDLVEIAHGDTNLLKLMSVNELLSNPTHFADTIITYTIDRKRAGKMQKNQHLINIFLKLGLINLALQYSCADVTQGADYIDHVPNHLEETLKDIYQNALEMTNPCLRENTLILIDEYLTRSDDKNLAMNVITTVIFSLTIFLLKLDISDKNLINNSMPIMETMFEYLKSYLNKFTFHLSEILVRATNGLTLAIKNNLDALADSEIMRESFRNLIQTIAARCMLEGRYKSSAMLYSHIEDNVNAIKSLMRTGEVDTVINYALLVKDFTVNRIAINYLKHLKVDTKTVEDFIARSQV